RWSSDHSNGELLLVLVLVVAVAVVSAAAAAAGTGALACRAGRPGDGLVCGRVHGEPWACARGGAAVGGRQVGCRRRRWRRLVRRCRSVAAFVAAFGALPRRLRLRLSLRLRLGFRGRRRRVDHGAPALLPSLLLLLLVDDRRDAVC